MKNNFVLQEDREQFKIMEEEVKEFEKQLNDIDVQCTEIYIYIDKIKFVNKIINDTSGNEERALQLQLTNLYLKSHKIQKEKTNKIEVMKRFKQTRRCTSL